MSETLTARLAAAIAAHPVTQTDRAAAVGFVLDAMANAVAGRRTPPGRMIDAWAQAEGGGPGTQAFRLGALAHILETDDLHRASVVHPGCVVVPAAWALARRNGADWGTFLEAVLWGYEAACRVGMAVGPAHYRIWHNTATCGPFGAAMAGARLLGLDHQAAVHALGNAGTQASGLWEFLATGAMSKHLHAGRAAQAGVVSAMLAALGLTGPPAILEGSKGMFAAMCPDARPELVVPEAGAPWQLHATSIKPWGCCRHTHPAIDAALALAPAVSPAEITAAEVTTYAAARDVCDRPDPDSAYAAQFSLQHTVAAALSGRAIAPDDFDAAARQALASLRSRVGIRVGDPFASAYPAAWGARVTVTLADGRTLVEARHAARGDPEAPLSATDLDEKAAGLLQAGGLSGDAARAWVAGIRRIAPGDPLPDLPV